MIFGPILTPSWGLLGPSWGHRGPSWGHLGAILGLLGAILGHLGPSWGDLGGNRSKKRRPLISAPPSGPEKSPLGALLGRSWGALGRSWARLGPLWGLSWGSLGPSWGHLEASRAHRKRKGEKAKNIDFHQVFKGFWPLGGVRSWSLLSACWELS